MLHKTSQERYEKLKRVFARLMKHFNLDDLDAVSYTHLDVYKRQRQFAPDALRRWLDNLIATQLFTAEENDCR